MMGWHGIWLTACGAYFRLSKHHQLASMAIADQSSSKLLVDDGKYTPDSNNAETHSALSISFSFNAQDCFVNVILSKFTGIMLSSFNAA